MDMDLNNRLTEDETLEQAYDIFLELAVDNLDPADVILFNLQFEERGGAELFDPAPDWEEHVDFDLNPDFLLKWSLVWPMKMAAKLTIFCARAAVP
ncbi:dsDNA-mimic protein [Klebsiella michiganensis]|nr:dsDNA-mimic protein [Klebsiella michiganensis]